MHEIVWIERNGLDSFAAGQQKSFRSALEQAGYTVRTQRYQPRAPWRLAGCEWLVWTFVPTQLDVWAARMFAVRQLALVHSEPCKDQGLPKLHGWCVPSESLRMHLLDLGVPGDRINIVQGYQVDASKEPNENAEPRIYVPGGLYPGMGHQAMLRMMTILQHLHPLAQVVFHGEGDELEKTEQQSRLACNEGTFRLASSAETVSDLVAWANIVCLPMQNDQVPDALFESLSQSKLILATKHPSLQEWLRHQENSWLLTDVRPPNWAGAIHQVWGDVPLQKKLREAARATRLPGRLPLLPEMFRVPQAVSAA